MLLAFLHAAGTPQASGEQGGIRGVMQRLLWCDMQQDWIGTEPHLSCGVNLDLFFPLTNYLTTKSDQQQVQSVKAPEQGAGDWDKTVFPTSGTNVCPTMGQGNGLLTFRNTPKKLSAYWYKKKQRQADSQGAYRALIPSKETSMTHRTCCCWMPHSHDRLPVTDPPYRKIIKDHRF